MEREVYVLVEKKKGGGSKVAFFACLVLALIGVAGFFAVGYGVAFLMAIIFGVLAWFIHKSSVEYEYSHFDGEVKFVKIKNKSRRKKIAIYNMEDVTMIAPVMDRSVYGQVNNPKMKVIDLTSQKEDANVYAMVAKGEQGPEVIKFEPDEQFLDAIAKKNAMKVKK